MARAIRSTRLLRLAVTARFNTDRMNEHLRCASSSDPTNILAEFNAAEISRWRWRFDRISPGAQLAEYVIHQEDIRTATGRPRSIHHERVTIALQGVQKLPGMKRRGRGPRPRSVRRRALARSRRTMRPDTTKKCPGCG
jgi:hypothetical protein